MHALDRHASRMRWRRVWGGNALPFLLQSIGYLVLFVTIWYHWNPKNRLQIELESERHRTTLLNLVNFESNEVWKPSDTNSTDDNPFWSSHQNCRPFASTKLWSAVWVMNPLNWTWQNELWILNRFQTPINFDLATVKTVNQHQEGIAIERRNRAPGQN